MKNKPAYSCFLIIALLYVNVITNTTIAHPFSSDDNSTFLTFINMILIENRLINGTIVNSSTNTSLNSIYSDNINEIIDDIIVSEDTLIIDSDQFYNNTIIATMMANLADEVLRKYGHAYDIPSNIMINMNFSAVDNIERNLTKELNSDVLPIGNYSSNLKDKSQYYGALETSKRMIEIFEKELNSTEKPLQKNNPLSNLENSLNVLNENIYNYSKPSKIMEIVHGNVHPYLQLAFNLTLKR